MFVSASHFQSILIFVDTAATSTIKLFTHFINSPSLKAAAFVSDSHFKPSLIFADKAGAYHIGVTYGLVPEESPLG